jgi:hypothetical protein
LNTAVVFLLSPLEGHEDLIQVPIREKAEEALLSAVGLA